jgi:hypothetical protein
MVAALVHTKRGLECWGGHVGKFDSLSRVVVELAALTRLGDA